MTGYALIAAAFVYLLLLFLVAFVGDRRREIAWPGHWGGVIYALTLAVYCTSWTFYGAVGTAARGGWQYLPIYLGPLILLAFGWRILERLILIAKARNVTSISDFIGSRYGKSRRLAVLVTVLAVCAALPYIALQLRSITQTFALAVGPKMIDSRDSALIVAGALALFAILFGTRHIDATEHHRGLMLAIAVESLVKLVALLSVGWLAVEQIGGGLPGLVERIASTPEFAARFEPTELPPGFLSQTVLAFLAIFCLPRQFHVSVVECEDPAHIRPARWLFGGYLLLVCIAVVPIAVAGLEMAAGDTAGADTFVLALPMTAGATWITVLAFIGGFSAASAMVIVVCVALSTMICNDIVVPYLLRGRAGPSHEAELSDTLLFVRRVAIVAIAFLGYAFHQTLPAPAVLADIGLLAFCAVAQFAPALLAGLYWPGVSARGAAAGLSAGFAVCAYTLLLPAIARTGLMPAGFIDSGPFGIAWLAPESLFRLTGWDRFAHGTFWSLLANVGCLVYFSLRHRPMLGERLAADAFLRPAANPSAAGLPSLRIRATVGDLIALASRIMGERYALRAFAERALELGRPLKSEESADRELVQFTERLVASAVGSASARAMVTSVLRGSGMQLEQVLALLDEASQAIRFNQGLLQATLESVSQGISVVDTDMRLVAWNRRYEEIFDYPPGLLYVGCPIADLIRCNAEHGECGPGDVEAHVQRRLAHMRQGTPHVFERVRPDGRVLEMHGNPMPGGGFVTSFSDVTAYTEAARQLALAKETLEQRVEQRTRELSHAVSALRAAKQEAEQANASKTRFLAAASHDLLQPFNAARLFSSALRQQLEGQDGSLGLVDRIDGSLQAAEELLGSLLDLARLDGGTLRPAIAPFDTRELIDGLAAWFGPLAGSRGIRFRVRGSRLCLMSDRQLLRRILQNFLNNALRYTAAGRVLLGCRRCDDALELQVIDTGPGISTAHLERLFQEFERGDHPIYTGEKGLGLGLSICDRIARILDHRMGVRSVPGQGSMFWVRVPLARSPVTAAQATPALATGSSTLGGLKVLCIDDDRNILDGMQALLGRWGCEVAFAVDGAEARAAARRIRPDVILGDFHLDREDGLVLVDELLGVLDGAAQAVMITADHGESLRMRLQERGIPLLRKPVRPGALRALLGAVAQRRETA
jgi:Na+/proline symporter/signal transduction histidine kinase